MITMAEQSDTIREISTEEIDQVGGGWRLVVGVFLGGLLYDSAKHAAGGLRDAFFAYGDAMSDLETTTDYENHPDYIGIGGPF